MKEQEAKPQKKKHATETAAGAETVTPPRADAEPADAAPAAESKESEPTVDADSSGGVQEAKGPDAELSADLEAMRLEQVADRAEIEKLRAALAKAQDALHRRSSEGDVTGEEVYYDLEVVAQGVVPPLTPVPGRQLFRGAVVSPDAEGL